MKVLFLDIDGVLNGYNFWNYVDWSLSYKLNVSSWYKTHIKSTCDIHEEKVKRLSKIVEQTGCKIVMSSSWRHGWQDTPYNKMSRDFKQLFDLLKKYKIEVMDITPTSLDGHRGKEISTWLSKYEDEIESFVILDDERSDLECFVGSRLVLTSSVKKGQIIKGYWRENTGLKSKHVKEVIRILNEIY